MYCYATLSPPTNQTSSDLQVHDACARIGAKLSSVEDFVEQLEFLASVQEKWKSLEHGLLHITHLYEIIDEFQIPLPELDRASFQTLNPDFDTLKSVMDECEASKDDNITQFSIELDSGTTRAASLDREIFR